MLQDLSYCNGTISTILFQASKQSSTTEVGNYLGGGDPACAEVVHCHRNCMEIPVAMVWRGADDSLLEMVCSEKWRTRGRISWKIPQSFSDDRLIDSDGQRGRRGWDGRDGGLRVFGQHLINNFRGGRGEPVRCQSLYTFSVLASLDGSFGSPDIRGT